MKTVIESGKLRIDLDTKGCELSAADIRQMEVDLYTLRKLIDDFPVVTLHITVIYHERNQNYHVTTALKLPGRTLFTGERFETLNPAFVRCVTKLTGKVRAYKQQMQIDEQVHRTHYEIQSNAPIDVDGLILAVETDDYPAFRRRIDVFEQALDKRIGRWVERYPDVLAKLGDSIRISDIVEEVFLSAFEQFSDRSRVIPPGEWLESFIDPAIQTLLQASDEDFAMISYSQSIVQ